jgi:hypothetical protein
MDVNEKCRVSESIAMLSFIKNGFIVLQPFGGSSRYDFVVEKNSIFKRIQVKTASIEKDILKFGTCSTLVGTKKTETKIYTSDEIDYFAAVDISSGNVYLMHVDDVSKGKQTLRLVPPKNKQVKGIKMAKDYLMDSNVYLK